MIPSPEAMRLALPFVTFFCVLCGYFVLRPVRDEIGVRAGIENMPWLFTGTFVATLLLVPLFGWVVARVRRGAIASLVYGGCAAALLLVWTGVRGAEQVVAYGVGLFIGISVLNLFLISVFWSVMADSNFDGEARKRYGPIAVGGTAGAIAGPAVTAFLATRIGPTNLLLVSATFLIIAAVTIALVRRRPDAPREQRIGGNPLAGIPLALRSPKLIRVALIVVGYTTISTILYFEQADIVGRTFADAGERTRYFALLDLTINSVTVITQALITSQVLTRLGLRFALTAVPATIGAGLLALAVAPRLAMVAFLQVIHRAGEHSMTRPGREVVFTTVDPEERYKAKNFIDTFIYRGNDALIGWLISGLHALGAGISIIALLGAGVAAGWAVNGRTLGRKHDAEQSVPT